jgi:hypothetical protein
MQTLWREFAMYTCPPIKRICINFQQNRCLCESQYIWHSRTYSLLYTNADTEIRCAVQRLRISATRKLVGGPSNYFCKLLWTRSHPYETKKENAPISTLGNVNTVLSPMTHSLLHKSRVAKPHTNSTIITSFVNRYTSPGFNYQTQHVTGNNVITHIYNSGHNLSDNASRSKSSSVYRNRTRMWPLTCLKLAFVSANKILLSQSRPWPLSHEFWSRIKQSVGFVTSDNLKPMKTEFLQHTRICQPHPKTNASDVNVVNQLQILVASDTTGQCTAHPMRCHFFTSWQEADAVIVPQLWHQLPLHISLK